jgi:hypothetical protein
MVKMLFHPDPDPALMAAADRLVEQVVRALSGARKTSGSAR